MVIKLTIEALEVGGYDPNTLLAQLLGCALNEQGITLATPQGTHFEIDLVNVEVPPDGVMLS